MRLRLARSVPLSAIVRSLLWAGGRRPGRARTRDILGGDSWSSFGSRFSALSLGSLFSVASVLSIGSAGSILSIGSAGSILSIGSIGSLFTIGGRRTPRTKRGE